MCGIIGAFNFGKNEEDVNESVLNTLQDQITRGREGFGITFIDDKGQAETKRATIESKAIIDLYMNKAKGIVMHHRMPTSSQNKISQTHPIEVKSGSLTHDYLVVHNGVIRNCKELRKKHEEELGFAYTTPRMRYWYNNSEEEFNDSEALAVELAMYLEGQTEGLSIEGSAAFIVVQTDKKGKVTKVFFGRNDGNPLKLSASRGKIRLSSEGEGENISANVLYSFDLDSYKIKKKELKFIKIEKEVKEYLPPVEIGFNANANVDRDLAEYEHFGSYNGYNVDVPDDSLAEIYEDNQTAAEGIITDFFEELSDEERLVSCDLERLYKDTVRALMIELREAKDKAYDAFAGTVIEEDNKQSTKQAGFEFTEKFNSK